MICTVIALTLVTSSGLGNRRHAYSSSNLLIHLDILEDSLLTLSAAVSEDASLARDILQNLDGHLAEVDSYLEVIELDHADRTELKAVVSRVRALRRLVDEGFLYQPSSDIPSMREEIAVDRKKVHTIADTIYRETTAALAGSRQDSLLAAITAAIGILIAVLGGTLFFFQQRELVQTTQTGELSKLLRAAATCTDEGILISDIGSGNRAAQIVFANLSFSRMTGIRVDELVGQPATTLHQRLFSEQERAFLEENMTASRSTRLETTTLRKDGTGFPAEWHISPVWDESGQLTHFISTLRDISERRAQEAQLIQSEKMAAIGQLAAGIIHEVINPVALAMSELRTLSSDMPIIKQYLHLLCKLKDAVESGQTDTNELLGKINEHDDRHGLADLVDETEEMLEAANDGLERARDIAGDLKGYSRPSEAEPEQTDINQLIESALKLTRGALKNKCTVVKQLGEVPQILSRPDQLFQVLTNLLINAAQAIPDSGDITVTTSVTESEVLIQVTDTGVGISIENQKKLFTPFFTTKPKGEGTGLGLSVSYGIIERLGGSIGVESAPGAGSTFTIRLPINPSEHEH
jgi:PAS domain S-box-containing protein